MSRFVLMAGSLMITSIAAAGTSVQVQYTGSVDFNIIPSAVSPLSGVAVGAPASISFQLDSDSFVDNLNFPTRSYDFAPDSFIASVGDFELRLESPYTTGFIAPSLVVRNNDPAVDGFFISDNGNFPDAIATDHPGGNGPFGVLASVTYNTDPLPSLDILDALGTYDFGGLTSFNWVLVDGPFDAMGFLFEELTISTVPEPTSLGLAALGLLFGLGCRRT